MIYNCNQLNMVFEKLSGDYEDIVHILEIAACNYYTSNDKFSSNFIFFIVCTIQNVC